MRLRIQSCYVWFTLVRPRVCVGHAGSHAIPGIIVLFLCEHNVFTEELWVGHISKCFTEECACTEKGKRYTEICREKLLSCS